MEKDLRALILADPGVAAVSPRVAWGERPQSGALPSIVLTRISGTPTYHMEGPAGMTETRVQADVWSETYASGDATAKALEGLLSGYRGSYGGTRFHGVFSEGATDLREAGANDADRFFRVSIDFMIHHSEE